MTKVLVEGKELLEAVAWVAKGLSKNSAIEHALITGTVKNNSLKLSSQSSEAAYSITVPVSRSGSDNAEAEFVVDGATLRQFATHLKGERIALEISKSTLKASGARSKFETPVVIAAKLVRNFPGTTVGTVLSGALREAVTGISVAVAAPTEPVAVLRGVKVEFRPGKSRIRFIGCDRYQLTYREIDFEPAPDFTEDTDIIIPGDALKTLVANMPPDATLDVRFESGNIFFGVTSDTMDGYVLSLQDAEYIPYEKMFSNPGLNQFTCNATEMQHAVQVVASMRSSATDGVAFEVEDNVVTVRTADGHNSMEVDIEADQPCFLSLDPKYVLNALRSATSETVRWSYSTANPKSVVFESLVGANKEADDKVKFLAASKKV